MSFIEGSFINQTACIRSAEKKDGIGHFRDRRFCRQTRQGGQVDTVDRMAGRQADRRQGEQKRFQR